MEMYCLKCRVKREIPDDQVREEVTEKTHMRMAKGICPECDTKTNKILGKADTTA